MHMVMARLLTRPWTLMHNYMHMNSLKMYIHTCFTGSRHQYKYTLTHLKSIEPDKSRQVGVARDEAKEGDEEREGHKRSVEKLHDWEQRHKRQGR
jgi:hypothetical protein